MLYTGGNHWLIFWIYCIFLHDIHTFDTQQNKVSAMCFHFALDFDVLLVVKRNEIDSGWKVIEPFEAQFVVLEILDFGVPYICLNFFIGHLCQFILLGSFKKSVKVFGVLIYQWLAFIVFHGIHRRHKEYLRNPDTIFLILFQRIIKHKQDVAPRFIVISEVQTLDIIVDELYLFIETILLLIDRVLALSVF